MPAHRGIQWVLLLVLSAVFAAILECAGLPAALLLGPMIAGAVISTNGGNIKTPRLFYYFAQGIIACLVARGITGEIVAAAADSAFLFIALIFGVLLAAGLLGALLVRWQVLPGTTAIWGCWPGGAAAMVIMAESYGADARLVAFMQYLRVAMVAAAAALVAWVWTGGSAARPEIIWFPEVDWPALLWTLAVAFGAMVTGILKLTPAGGFVPPLVVGSVLHATGILDIELPPWLLAMAYAVVGSNIGLGFTRKILAHAWRSLPRVFGTVVALIAICGFYAYLLHVFAGIDPLTAYLAASPGGADSVAIIAASTNVDVPFVMAMQVTRLFVVLLCGPYIARFFALRSAKKTDPPPTPPLD